MDFLIGVTLIGLISGIVGTGIGGLMAFFVKKISNRLLGSSLEFSAGLMTAVVCFELIPEALTSGGAFLTFSGIFLGIISIIGIEGLIRNGNGFKKKYKDSRLLKTGIIMGISVALHNLPEGFAVGSGFEASARLGITLTAIIGIHDIPEGFAMAMPMKVGGFSGGKVLLLTILSGVPMGIGAFVGAVLGSISSMLISVCLGFAGGAMLYVVFGELVPESKRLYVGRLSSLGNILGLLCGIIVSIY